MSRKKFEKILKNNLDIDNNFDKINQKIDYDKYISNQQSSRKFNFFSKKVMIILSSFLVILVSLPIFINGIPYFKNTTSSSENSLSSKQQLLTSSLDSTVETQENSSLDSSKQEISSNIYNSSQSCISEYVEVYGIIKNDETNEKKFYTDETYGYVNVENENRIFSETGYYDLGDLYILGYTLNDDKIEKSLDSNEELLVKDFPLNTLCIGKINIDTFYLERELIEIKLIED